MCLTIPKKVISQKGDFIILEAPDGTRQEVKSLVPLKAGDYCFTQQNIAIEKINEKEALQIINIIKDIKKI